MQLGFADVSLRSVGVVVVPVGIQTRLAQQALHILEGEARVPKGVDPAAGGFPQAADLVYHRQHEHEDHAENHAGHHDFHEGEARLPTRRTNPASRRGGAVRQGHRPEFTIVRVVPGRGGFRLSDPAGFHCHAIHDGVQILQGLRSRVIGRETLQLDHKDRIVRGGHRLAFPIIILFRSHIRIQIRKWQHLEVAGNPLQDMRMHRLADGRFGKGQAERQRAQQGNDGERDDADRQAHLH